MSNPSTKFCSYKVYDLEDLGAFNSRISPLVLQLRALDTSLVKVAPLDSLARNSNLRTAQLSEEIVACVLSTLAGFQILVRNFRTRGSELDIVALAEDGSLVVVEVKYRNQFCPESSRICESQIWGRSKRRALIAGVERFLSQNPIATSIYFDLAVMNEKKLFYWSNLPIEES